MGKGFDMTWPLVGLTLFAAAAHSRDTSWSPHEGRTISHWLSELNLSDYTPLLHDLGVDRLPDLLDLDAEDRIRIATSMKKYHAVHFRSALSALAVRSRRALSS